LTKDYPGGAVSRLRRLPVRYRTASPCYVVAALAVASILCCGTTKTLSQPAQQTDPYANSYRQQQVARYNQELDAYLNLVRTLYFADGCNVFEAKADAYLLYFPSYDQLLTKGALITRHSVQNQLFDQTQAAIRDGRARASQPGACEYWHQHPEEVYQMRQVASVARLQ
jgi:hypothetical protein